MNSKELILASVVSGEVGRLGKKMEFWDIEAPEAGSIWESQKPMNLEQAISIVDPEDPELINSDYGTMYGIAWEFVWGKKPPEVVTLMRNAVRTKISTGMEITELEKLWYQIMCVDTDEF